MVSLNSRVTRIQIWNIQGLKNDKRDQTLINQSAHWVLKLGVQWGTIAVFSVNFVPLHIESPYNSILHLKSIWQILAKCWLLIYCQTCIERSPLGQRKCGLIRQVSSWKRFNSCEIFYDAIRKMWPFKTDDCLIEVTSMAGFTMHIFSYHGKSFLVMSIYMNLIIQLTSIFLLLIEIEIEIDLVVF